ncbi:hypothetical protein BC834DRAFT_843133 [Gloeopeniophorella convolvens]|nr:hypothetical protein BC834DRAFT_843133 [Gloeopeniophorella convolvens]
MPVLDKNVDNDFAREPEREKGREGEARDREKGPKAKGPAKSKDLSHVPCKFFKVGSCTAGASCPFSHAANEPGQQKGVCAWFVKGNCKFGHKCALAHILPGQSMSMDRKNKKAAQLAASANGQPREGSKGAKSQKPGAQPNTAAAGAGSGGASRNTLLSGSTAPTRILQGSARAPMPITLKAAVSPSAPAPPVQDTDFASYGLPDESNKLPSAPAQNKSFSPPEEDAQLPVVDGTHAETAVAQEDQLDVDTPSSPLPFHSPSLTRQVHVPTNAVDLGPIGSPRSVSSHDQPTRTNGLSPGTSPSQGAGLLSTSPFSAPGTQSVFFSYENKPNHSEDFKARSGIAASLGATRTWRAELPAGGAQDRFGSEIVVEDEDLEDFVPGSLSELLTPEERSRRYSRTRHTNAPAGAAWPANPRPSAETHHHRYSRSVPAPSLLGDIKSIWSEGGQNVVGSPLKTGLDLGAPGGGPVPAVGNGTPSSFRSNSGFGGRSLADDHINSFLSPSNASAAFLPGPYHRYLNSGNGGHRAGATAGAPTLRAYTPAGANGPASVNAANLLARINDPAPAPVHRQPFDGTSESLGNQPFQLGRPIPNGVDFRGEPEDGHNVLSPSARALQAHAPGQSLPQGLAAGYSRIHAMPPPPGIPSPAASSAMAPSQPNSFAPSSSFQANASDRAQFSEWLGMSPGAHPPHGVTGLEPLPARALYTNVAAVRQVAQPGGPPASRNVSGKSWGTPLSPLTKPVATGDDDDLFDMDR